MYIVIFLLQPTAVRTGSVRDTVLGPRRKKKKSGMLTVLSILTDYKHVHESN